MAIKRTKKAKLQYRKLVEACNRERETCLKFLAPMASRGLAVKSSCDHSFKICLRKKRRRLSRHS